MKKTKLIVTLVMIAIMVALLAIAGFTGGAQSTVDCPDCADGYLSCESCEGEGTLDGAICEECIGKGKVQCGTCGAETTVVASFWALLPPIIAIVLALITKEVYSSLFIGIVSAGLLAANFNPIGTLDAVLNDGLLAGIADSYSIGILIFLVLLGIFVALINRSGGSAAFGRWAQTHVKTRVGAMLATFALGVLIFVDDYFNCLTVGSVMRPVSDTHKISRAKLAYIIDATAAPICMIAPISSWAAAVSGVVVGMSGITLFIKAIPYNFYSLLTIVMVIALALMKFDYGPMKKHEINALAGDLFTEGEKNEAENEMESGSPKGRVIDLLLPIIVLIVSCVCGMLYTGGLFDGAGFIEAFENCDASVGLPWGAFIALIFTIIYLVARGLVSFHKAMECIPKGFIAMVPAILILCLAWSLCGLTGGLGAKYFVANLMQGGAAGLTIFLPAIIFIVAVVLAFSTGTSWGTFGILIPIVTEVFAPGTELLYIGISACLAGAVCGDHASPISDTTIMASAGAQCNHVNHVSTQLPYAITVAAVSFVCYILAGFINAWYIVLPIGIALMIGTLFAIKIFTQKKKS